MQKDETATSVRAALARGDLLAAYDEVSQGKERGHTGLEYLEVLTLARLGDTERGLRLYDAYDLGATADVDALSLKARLLKDLAFSSGTTPDLVKVLESCRIYAAVYQRTRSSYPAINAATLARIAGRDGLAAPLARRVVRQVRAEGRQDYFSLATKAEALVVLGELEQAREALGRAVEAPDADVGSRSTTFLQLQRLMAAAGAAADAEILDPVRPPRVAMFCGNLFVGGEALESDLARQTADIIRSEKIGFGYGALAAGSDILIAEELLAAGAELHVILPFAEADFLEQSVKPAGDSWVRRYHACRDRATTVTFASNMSYMGQPAQFGYGSKVTMGMARLRARHLHGEAIQLAIVEGAGSGTLSGSDINAWQAVGSRSAVIGAPRLIRPPLAQQPPPSEVERGTYGIMFTDFPGFANLDERVLPLFWKEVMLRAATALDRHSAGIRESNTWGDALYVVFDDARGAAAAALDLAEELGMVDTAALGVPQGTSMRIALHYGTTYSAYDPIAHRTTYYGTEVSRAARIEPVTPAGSVYVTEPFAAVLEMERDHPFTCNYVGRTPLAKGYGVYPLYRLRRDPTGGRN